MRQVRLENSMAAKRYLNGAIPTMIVHEEGDYISDIIVKGGRFYEEVPLIIFRDLLEITHSKNISGFLDIGANIGNHSLFMQRTIKNISNIIMIEAAAENVMVATKNVPSGLVINAAASDESGLAEFYVYEKSFGACTLKSLWDPVFGEGIEPGWSAGGKHRIDKVAQIKIDDLHLSRLDGIKMDIEGAEMRALKGMKRTLEEQKPLLWVEMHNQEVLARSFEYSQEDVIEYLRELNYDLAFLDRMNYIFIEKQKHKKAAMQVHDNMVAYNKLY